MSETRRLFVGIALDALTRAACSGAIDGLRRAGFAARFEGLDKLHVTLAFLGNVESSRFDDVVAAMSETATPLAPFELTLDKVGAFPNERKPRVIYVGARDQGAPYRELCARLRSAYGDLGFTFKDDAVAHVTIARVKDPHRPLPLIEVAPVALQVTILTLFESIFDQSQNTSRYVEGATSRLAG